MLDIDAPDEAEWRDGEENARFTRQGVRDSENLGDELWRHLSAGDVIDVNAGLATSTGRITESTQTNSPPS